MSNGIEVEGTRPESPHDAALYEAGKRLLVESVDVGREFCKFMVGIAAGAIPTYLALVGLALGKNYRPNVVDGCILLVAPALFLISATVFALGYFPHRSQFSLEVLGQIEQARTAVVNRRYRRAATGFAVFAVATAWAIGGATYALSIKPPPTAAASASSGRARPASAGNRRIEGIFNPVNRARQP